MKSSSRLLLGLGLVLLGVFFLAPAVHAGILDTSWTAPTTNADLSPLTDLASYKLYYGTSPVTCPGGSTFVSIPSPTTSPTAGTTVNYRLTGLQAGTTYYLGVTAVDTSGIESACSNATSALARIEFSVTPSTPPSVDFGTVNLGSTADRTFTVQNIVGGTVSGTATGSAPYSVVAGSPFNLTGNGATQTVTVRFTPTTTGAAARNVNFTGNGDTISRAVTGTGSLAALTLTSLTANLTAPQPPGTTITFTATASGGTAPYQSKWWFSDGTTWSVIQNWATGMTFTWTPTTPNPNYYFAIQIRSAGSTIDNVPAAGSIPFAITAAPNPVPTLGSFAPSSASAGGAAFTLAVTGSNFVSASVVNWNGSARSTTFVSSTQLTAAISAADIATAGSASVTVATPAPGGGTSGALPFTITAVNPVPTLTTLSPSNATAGAAGFALTVNGSNFVSSAVVRWNGTNRTTTFVSSTQLTAAISAADIATAGSASVTVATPAPGGGTSGALPFTITAVNPVPTLTTLSPSNATAGAAGFALTVNGSNFVSSAVVRWNGTNRTTTFVSSTQLTAAVDAADIAAAGTAQVTVVTPAPGGGTSTALSFTINPSPLTLTGFAADRTSPQPPGTTITFTATATGGTAPYQSKWWFSDGTTWSVIQNWATGMTFTWTPTTPNPNYQFAIQIRSAGSTTDNVPAAGSMPFAIQTGAPLTLTNLTANLTAPQPPGTTITFTATATGGTAPYQSKWWFSDGTTWSVIQNWATGMTFTWTPTTPNPNYQFAIQIRSAGSTADNMPAAGSLAFPVR